VAKYVFSAAANDGELSTSLETWLTIRLNGAGNHELVELEQEDYLDL
jgi:hypothetical protein